MKLKLNKVICIVCALCIALTTFIYNGVSAMAAETSSYDTTDINTTATAFDIASKMSEYITFGGVSLSTDVLYQSLNTYLDAQTGGYLLVDDTANTAYYLNVDGVLVRSKSGESGGGGVNRHVESSSDIEFSGETFSKIVERLNEQYAPKTVDYKIISIQNDNRYEPVTSSAGNLSFFTDGYYCNQTDWLDCYIVPFYTDGTQYYFGLMSAHFTQEVTASDSGNSVTMNVEFTSLFDSEYSAVIPVMRNSYSVDFANYRYMDLNLHFSSNGMNPYCYPSYSDYISKSSSMYCKILHSGDSSGLYAYDALYSANCLDAGTYDNIVYAANCYPNCYTDSSTYISGADMGFIVSDKEIVFSIDWTGIDPYKIDPTLTIIPDGDNIDDFHIKNGDGDITTINEYVTNNYNITIGGGGESTGGSTSGNVNVSGNIGVGGEVDININVNENSSMPVEVDLENYIEVIPEQAKPVTNILALFFDFLPVELMSLILAGVAVAIILRIWGR